ncbi:MAG: hypothetical protein IKF82_00190 [Bacilli bacterium]|nr:hypothetical protein [Bacilli bacterium]
MTTKKDTKEKKIVKTIAKESKSIEEPVMIPKEKEFFEPSFFAKDLADQMGIDSFDFLLMKREMGLEDNSIITVAEMQKMYNTITRR